MNLLQRSPDGGINLKEVEDEKKTPPYAILSHTWLPKQEVMLQELQKRAGRRKAGSVKIQFCIDQARKHGIEFSWVDTCCIDQTNPAKVATCINSMGRWYRNAQRCYVYLADVSVPDDIEPKDYRVTWINAFERSRWFTRGWTLQELLLPQCVEFYSKEGKFLGTKITLEEDIARITKIPMEALRNPLATFTRRERSGWIRGRETKVDEDIAYCLLGLFDISMPVLYGEGRDKALRRLRREVRDAERDLESCSSQFTALGGRNRPRGDTSLAMVAAQLEVINPDKGTSMPEAVNQGVPTAMVCDLPADATHNELEDDDSATPQIANFDRYSEISASMPEATVFDDSEAMDIDGSLADPSRSSDAIIPRQPATAIAAQVAMAASVLHKLETERRVGDIRNRWGAIADTICYQDGKIRGKEFVQDIFKIARKWDLETCVQWANRLIIIRRSHRITTGAGSTKREVLAHEWNALVKLAFHACTDVFSADCPTYKGVNLCRAGPVFLDELNALVFDVDGSQIINGRPLKEWLPVGAGFHAVQCNEHGILERSRKLRFCHPDEVPPGYIHPSKQRNLSGN